MQRRRDFVHMNEHFQYKEILCVFALNSRFFSRVVSQVVRNVVSL
jgi:hypothetical protein